VSHCSRILPFGLTETNYIEVPSDQNQASKEFITDNGILDEASPDLQVPALTKGKSYLAQD